MISTLYHLKSPITFKGLHHLVWDIVDNSIDDDVIEGFIINFIMYSYSTIWAQLLNNTVRKYQTFKWKLIYAREESILIILSFKLDSSYLL